MSAQNLTYPLPKNSHDALMQIHLIIKKIDGHQTQANFTLSDIRFGKGKQNVLQVAIQHNLNDFAKQLITNGFKIDTVDDDNYTALHTAVRHANVEMVNLLLEQGANPNAKNNHGDSPFSLAVCPSLIHPFQNTFAIISAFLCNEKLAINQQNKTGETALHYLFYCQPMNFEQKEILYSLLCKHGASTFICNEQSLTPWSLLKSMKKTKYNDKSNKISRGYFGIFS